MHAPLPGILFALMLVPCGVPRAADSETSAGSCPAHLAASPAGEALPRGSIYAVATAPLQNDLGASVDLSKYRGRPVILGLFYTTCHVVCPATVSELLEVCGRLPRGSGIPILLVTMDPQTDTVAHLAEFRAEERLPDGIVLLRGPPRRVRALADAAGICYRVEADRIVHAPKVVVLDGNGLVAASFPGTHASAAKIVASAIQAERPSKG